MKHKITLIPGDGIGPEVTKPALAIIKAAGVNVAMGNPFGRRGSAEETWHDDTEVVDGLVRKKPGRA